MVQSGARLSVKQGRLIVKQSESEVGLPLEDMATIIIDHPQVFLSTPLLRAVAEAGISVLVCDGRHLPCGIYLGQHQHFRSGEVAAQQVALKRPFKKQLWQLIVRAKVRNQAYVVEPFDREVGRRLLNLLPKVKSGDPRNIEALAARYYWPALLGVNFRRSDDGFEQNRALNYGYSIIRSALARGVVGRGLQPIFGIHHDNQLNPFPLVDDLIEPFRPFVDAEVREYFEDDSDVFEQRGRHRMIELLERPVLLGAETFDLAAAITQTVDSLLRAYRSRRTRELVFPSFPH